MSVFDDVSDAGRLNKVKNGLETWRELVIRADSFLGWECDWYPAVTGGVLTSIFLFVWYWDPTLLTFLAALGLFTTIADFAGPKIINQVFGSDSWNVVKDKKYDEVCHEIVAAIEGVSNAFHYWRAARSHKPIVHFFATCLSLIVLAWLGNKINNFFLAYMLVLGLLMLPGLHRRGILQTQLAQVTLKVNELMGKAKEAGGAKKVE